MKGALCNLKCAVIYVLAVVLETCFAQICPTGGPVTFAKISSLIPKTTVQPILLYATTPGTAITAECYNRCLSSDDCAGFIIDYQRSSCFRVPLSEMNTGQYIPARNSNFFQKICIGVPANCTKMAWAIEFAPNSELVGYQQHVIPKVADQWQCAQLCLNGATQYRYGPNIPCYSAQYQHWSQTCTLSSENRRTKPEAFNLGVQEGVDYIENLCVVSDTGLNKVGCWHEPIYNATLLEIDLQIPNLTLEQCRERCETEEYFPCRGFTHKCSVNPVRGSTDTTCYLHSDDTLTSGPLVPATCTTYVERLTCIDLKVECSANSMMLTLHYKGFQGRMFVVGYADECGVSGYNQDVTTLVLPITTDPRALNRCGLFVAQSIGYGNRKLATAVIAVQRHPIIQTLGDRIAKVTCIAEDGTDRLPRPLFNNITLESSFVVAEPTIQTSIMNEVANISSSSPIARLRILDLARGGAEASETVLGEELELRVDIYPPFNASVLRAGHLVASSGDGRDSLLLLDWRGCPPDPSTFPALKPSSSTVLSAIFKAFRFPTSAILKFSLILTICDGICQPTDCGNGLTSWGRRKRSSDDDLNEQEIPLQLAIIVRAVDREEVYNSSNVESMPYSTTSIDEHLCISWPVLVTLFIIFGLVHIIILAACSFMFYREKRLLNDQVSLNNDFQPRHVTWADHHDLIGATTSFVTLREENEDLMRNDLFTNRGEDTIKYEHIYRRRESNTSGSEDTDNFIVGDRVLVGGSKCGVIAFIGETQFGPGDWAGVVLDEPVGKNDGTVSGIRYFQCPRNKGIFCRLSKLTRYRPGLTAHELLRLHGRPETPDSRRTSSNNSYGSSVSPPPRARTPISYRSNQGAHRSDLQAGDRVIVSSSQGSKVGVLRYIGHTDFGNGIWCGVELNDPLGKNDGSVSGIRYFDCAPKFGLFVPLEKVSRSPISRPKSQPCVIHPDGTNRQGTVETSTNTKAVRVKIYHPEWESDYY